MKNLLAQLRGRVVLLWFARALPPPRSAKVLAGDPLFVDREMIEALRPRVSHVLEVTPSHEAALEGTQGLIYADYDTCAAQESLGARAHEELADLLASILQSML